MIVINNNTWWYIDIPSWYNHMMIYSYYNNSNDNIRDILL